MSELRALAGLVAPHRASLAAASGALLGESAAALAVPWALGILVARMLGGSGTLPVLLVLLALFALQALLRFASTYLLERVADRLVADLKVRLYDHLQALPVEFHHRRRLGDTLALLTTDVHIAGAYVSATAAAVPALLVTATGAAALMFFIRADLALLAAAAIPLCFLLLKVAGRRMRPLATKLRREEAHAVAIVQENLGLLPAIKAFTREAHESARHRGQVLRILELSARQRWFDAGLGPLVQLVAAGAMLSILGLAGPDVAAGRMSPGDLVAFLLYALLLARPMGALADVYGQTQVVRAALRRLMEAMCEPAEPGPAAGRRLARVRGAVEFRGVSFAYESGATALDGVDLRIEPGQTVALVGPNGAGKSTLAHLLMRLHRPAAGSILIDDVDVSEVSLESLRGQIGIVPQHVMLFNATVRDNIAYGRAGASEAEIESAARIAALHDVVRRLPQGYDTVVGDRGVRLSGGQQQRLALARAILKDPPILVLDEATAMFDPESEEQFLQACRASLGTRTVIFITHRPASLRVADRIVHMRDGRIERIETPAGRELRLVLKG